MSVCVRVCEQLHKQLRGLLNI